MRINGSGPRSIEQLLNTCHSTDEHADSDGQIISLSAEDGHDVYNITAPVEYNGSSLIAGRHEHRQDELSSQTRFYKYSDEDDKALPLETVASLPLQDPSITRINNNWLVSGVRIHTKPTDPKSIDYWQTEFYTGGQLEELTYHSTGPKGMKDIRLVQMEDEIGIFTRPQGKKGGAGKIGFTAIKNMLSLNAQTLDDAPLINGVINHELGEWGGVNEAHYLGDGKIGVLAHMARFVVKNGLRTREYYPSSFIYDVKTGKVDNEQIIACRACFPPTAAKRQDLHNVVFPGGLKIQNGHATLFAGISDTSAGKKRIANPFL